LHATAKFHQLLAVWHLQALAAFRPEKLHSWLSNGVVTIAFEHFQTGRD
jgi:formylglycine-generating enzyme required for sulfatase activity